MKTVSVLIPCYNEQDNICEICVAVKNIFKERLKNYNCEIIIIDNKSKDNSREKIRGMCREDKNIKAIFNLKNFGQFNSPYYGLCQTTGDCTILLCADFQDPVECIPQMVKAWEEGHKVVCMVKSSSKENKIMYFLRSVYYKLIKSMSTVEQIEHFTGFGLYDKSFIEILKNLKEPSPFLRGIVAEYAPERCVIEYEQQKRKSGKTSNNFFSLYDAAMISFTAYTKGGLRLATFLGFFISICSFIVSLIFFVEKLLFWDRFVMGYAPMMIAIFFMGGVQLSFMGFMGEYIMSMNTRIINRPLVIEEERINFESSI